MTAMNGKGSDPDPIRHAVLAGEAHGFLVGAALRFADGRPAMALDHLRDGRGRLDAITDPTPERAMIGLVDEAIRFHVQGDIGMSERTTATARDALKGLIDRPVG